MPIRRYNQHILAATQKLINAVNDGEYAEAELAIKQGADVNCRIIKIDDNYRVAYDVELQESIHSKSRSYPTTPETPVYDTEHEVQMVGTTTLLNIIAKRETKSNGLRLAQLLMENDVELGAIDYASYWESWGNSAENYFQNTPLLNAIAADHLEFANLYMQFLVKLEKYKQREILDYKDKFAAGFHTALEFAIRRGFSQLATSIVRAGANPNPQPFIFAYAGQSPLHMACMMLGQSRAKSRWHPQLGSDLELILILLEHGADFNVTVNTSVYDGIVPGTFPPFRKWRQIDLAAFDHIDVALGVVTSRPFDFVNACYKPAFRPEQLGQIKHPFEEENCFLNNAAMALRAFQSRTRYLASDDFTQTDKVILQKAILKRIIKDALEKFGTDTSLNEIDVDGNDVQTTVDTLLKHPLQNWLQAQLQYGGIIYNADKVPSLPRALPVEENPILTLQARNKILHCRVNDLDSILRHTTVLPQVNPGYVTYAQLMDPTQKQIIEDAFRDDPTETMKLHKTTFAIFRDKTWDEEKREAASHNWKIHISVQADDLARAWDLLYPVLHQYVKEFKVVDQAKLINAQREQQDRFQHAQQDYQRYLTSSVDMPQLKTLAAQLSHERAEYEAFFNDEGLLRDFVNKQYIKQIQRLQSQVEEGRRMAVGMQITLYLLPGTEPSLAPVLKQIETILHQNEVRPGEIYRTDRTLGDYCSVRHPGVEYQEATMVAHYNPEGFDDPFQSISTLKLMPTMREDNMTRKIALLDVDETLLYDAEGTINDALIDELVSAQVVDVYLFTNMELKDIRSFGREGAPRSRYALVEYLKTKGLNVLGVITPADKYCAPVNEAAGLAYQTIYLPLMEKRQRQQTALNLSDYSSAETLEYMYADLQWKRANHLISQQSKLAVNQQTETTCLGLRVINKTTREKCLFLNHAEASAFFATPENCQQFCLDLDENPADKVTVIGSHNRNLKGMMMEHFLLLPGVIQPQTEIYFFDDRRDFIDGVHGAVADYNSTTSMSVILTTCLMPQDIMAAQHPAQRAAYRQCLNGQSITQLPTIQQEPDYQEETNTESISSSLLLKILSHPVTKVVGAVLLLAGVASIVVGTCGLAGVAIGISAVLAKILLGVGCGVTVATGVGFFASSRMNPSESDPLNLAMAPH